MKPAPAAVSTPTIHEEFIRLGLRRALDTAKGCIVEIIVQDNHTLGKRPESAVRWCQIAKEGAERIS